MNPSPLPSPPPDLWSRLARLDGQCDVRLSSEPEPAIDGSWRWVCTVIVRHRHAGAAGAPGSISVSAPRAADALTRALEQAEARGWSGPGSAS